MKLPQALRAPETGEGTAVEENVKRKVAEHGLINANGSPVENEEEATGISYKQLATGETFTYQTGGEAGKALTMLAVFGAKTLATNEASQVRNNPKGAGSDAEQMQAIKDRFAMIEAEGKWVDRTREGVGAKVDKDKLAGAIIEVLTAQGKITDADSGTMYAKVRQKLEDDPKYQATARNVPGVPEAYAKAMGRQTRTVDELVAGL